MNIATPLSETLGRYLTLTGDQLKLTASNMANVDTPGYKTQGFDFQQTFVQQLNTSPDHAGGLDLTPQAMQVDGLVARPDGNNVSMDREGIQLAKEQLQFRLGEQLLRNEFSTVLSAIHG